MNQRQRKQKKEEKPSLVPPFLAALLSLVIPGLGQMLAGAFRRGLMLFLSFITIGVIVLATQIVQSSEKNDTYLRL